MKVSKSTDSESVSHLMNMTSLCRSKDENFFQLIDNLSVGFGWRHQESKMAVS